MKGSPGARSGLPEPSPLRLLAGSAEDAPDQGVASSRQEPLDRLLGGRADTLVWSDRQSVRADRALAARRRPSATAAATRISGRVSERPQERGRAARLGARADAPQAMIASRRRWPFSSPTAAARPRHRVFGQGAEVPEGARRLPAIVGVAGPL